MASCEGELSGVFLRVKNADKLIYKQIKKRSSDEPGTITNEDILLTILEGEENFCSFILKDKDDAEIPLHNLVNIVGQFSGCACFVIKIDRFDKEQPGAVGENLKQHNAAIGSDVVIYKEGLEAYIKASPAAYILDEYSRSNSLKDSSRRALVTAATDYLRSICGNYPSKEAKIACAKAIILIFKTFKTPNSKIGGYELFFDPTSNKGYLASKIKNINIKRHKCDGTYGQVKSLKLSQSLDNVATNSGNTTLEQEDKEFFENCLAIEQEEIIKQRLLKTLESRNHILQEPIDLFKQFNFFIFNTNLILFDFQIRYPGAEQRFLNQWKKYASVVKDIFCELFTEKSIKEIEDWNQEISSFLLLLRMLPSTSQGPKSKEKKRSSFENSISKLIKFEELNTPKNNYDLLDKQPHIIAVGPNKQAVSQYFIVVDKKIICCPINYSFCETFDLFFKIFYVFNIEFDYSLKTFLDFFAICIYNIQESPRTSRLIEIQSKFHNKFSEAA